jgi:hypothetical protein
MVHRLSSLACEQPSSRWLHPSHFALDTPVLQLAVQRRRQVQGLATTNGVAPNDEERLHNEGEGGRNLSRASAGLHTKIRCVDLHGDLACSILLTLTPKQQSSHLGFGWIDSYAAPCLLQTRQCWRCRCQASAAAFRCAIASCRSAAARCN